VVGEEIARVKIWSRDLRVVYSDDTELIGRAFPSSNELEDAMDGQIVSEVSDLTKEENVGDRSDGKLLEVYVPLTLPGDPAPAGAFELYLPYLPIEAAVARDNHRLYLLLGGLALLYVALFRIVATASRRLRRQADRELRLANEERDLALRKAAVIATVSHEFRTPLTIIEGVSSTLQRHDLVAGDGHSLLDSLRNASHRLHDLVEALLATAEGIEREAEVERRPVALSEVIQGVVHGLSSFDAHSRVRVVAIPDGDTVMSDPAMLTALLAAYHGERAEVLPTGEPGRHLDRPDIGRGRGQGARSRSRYRPGVHGAGLRSVHAGGSVQHPSEVRPWDRPVRGAQDR
jgi:signal transduction histidine kinase